MTAELDDRLRDAHADIDPGPPPPSTTARLDALIADAARERAARARTAPPRPGETTPAAPRRDHRRPRAAMRPGRANPVVAGRRRRRPRAAALAFAASGLAVLAIVVVALLPGSSERPAGLPGLGPSSARAACATPGPAGTCASALSLLAGTWRLPGHGDVLYRRSVFTHLQFTVMAHPTGQRNDAGPNQLELATAKQPFVVERHGVREDWIAPDGSARLSSRGAPRVVLPTPQDRAAWETAGRPDLERLVPHGDGDRPTTTNLPTGGAAGWLLGAGGLYDDLAHDGDPLAVLPRDPSRLEGWLREHAFGRQVRDQGPGAGPCVASGDGCSADQRRMIDGEVAIDVVTLLGYPASPAPLRAALVAVLAAQPGARSLGLLRDPRGREVAAVALAAPEGAWDVVAFDPDSGELRGTATTTDSDALRWQQLSVLSARVEHVGDRP